MLAAVQRLLPYQIFNFPLISLVPWAFQFSKVKLYPQCNLTALPANPLPIHTILQLESAVSLALQHPQHPSASLMTPLPEHSPQKAMPDAWSKLLPKSCPFSLCSYCWQGPHKIMSRFNFWRETGHEQGCFLSSSCNLCYFKVTMQP